MDPSDSLVRFIRQTLGCECPDEVVQSIDCDSEFMAPNTDWRTARLDVGGRLLVYVLEVAHTSVLSSLVPTVVEAGIADRNRNKFNRFRLVLAATDADEIEGSAGRLFDTCYCPDGRIHLHVVNLTEVPAAIRPTGNRGSNESSGV
jgi:hypothetical protein